MPVVFIIHVFHCLSPPQKYPFKKTRTFVCFHYCWIPAAGSFNKYLLNLLNTWMKEDLLSLSLFLSCISKYSDDISCQFLRSKFSENNWNIDRWFWYISVRGRNSKCDWKCAVAMSSTYPFLLCLSFGACEESTSLCSLSSQAGLCSGAEVKHVPSRPKPFNISLRPSSSVRSPEEVKCSRSDSSGMAGPLFSLDPAMSYREDSCVRQNH